MNTTKRWRVFQAFATLGEPTEVSYTTLAEAKAGAEKMRYEIVDMLTDPSCGLSATPDKDPTRTGDTSEGAVWSAAYKLCGLVYDQKTGERIAGPQVYTKAAAQEVANAAVQIGLDEEASQAFELLKREDRHNIFNDPGELCDAEIYRIHQLKDNIDGLGVLGECYARHEPVKEFDFDMKNRLMLFDDHSLYHLSSGESEVYECSSDMGERMLENEPFTAGLRAFFGVIEPDDADVSAWGITERSHFYGYDSEEWVREDGKRDPMKFDTKAEAEAWINEAEAAYGGRYDCAHNEYRSPTFIVTPLD